MTSGRQQHWDQVHAGRAEDEVSWFQAQPSTSLRLVELATRGRAGAAVIDVGAGTSTLVDVLLAVGQEVTVLDVSGEALAAVGRRLSLRAAQARLVQADLLDWQPDRPYDVWHDRAVFHFLTAAQDVVAYVDLVSAAVASQGALVLGVFAPDGPTSCSGLPTARYDTAALTAHFAAGFVLEHEERELHLTPSGGVQAFTWVVLRRRRTDRPDHRGDRPCADQRPALSAAGPPGPDAAGTSTACWRPCPPPSAARAIGHRAAVPRNGGGGACSAAEPARPWPT